MSLERWAGRWWKILTAVFAPFLPAAELYIKSHQISLEPHPPKLGLTTPTPQHGEMLPQDPHSAQPRAVESPCH